MLSGSACVQTVYRDEETSWPILVCVLGGFRVLKSGVPVTLRGGSKGAALLCALALRRGHAADRDSLLQALWPASGVALAGQSLNSLTYSLHKLLGDSIDGAEPVVHADGCYRLNREAGVGVDLACFDVEASSADRLARAGREAEAVAALRRAVGLYRGDMSGGGEIEAIVERERLRASYLTVLARLGDYEFARGDYAACLEQVHRLLAGDPCREDAHRLAMRCYVRRGERTQALRQYRLCETVLRAEFDTSPETATVALFEQLQRDPANV